MSSSERAQGAGAVNPGLFVIDDETFTTLYKQEFAKTVWFIAKRFPKLSQEAEELAQQTWTNVWRYRDQYRGEATFRSWVYSIAYNVTRVYIRRLKAKREDVLLDVHAVPDKSIVAVENKRTCATYLGRVHGSYLKVLVSYYCDDNSGLETARKLGMHVANVKSHVHRAIIKMRDAQ